MRSNRELERDAETPAEGRAVEVGSLPSPEPGRAPGGTLRGRTTAIGVAVLVVVALVAALVLTRGGSSSTRSPEQAFIAELNGQGWGIETGEEAGLVRSGRSICDYWAADGFAFGAEQTVESAGLSPRQGPEFLAASTHAFCPGYAGKLDPDRYISG